jgi:hypothetical protein
MPLSMSSDGGVSPTPTIYASTTPAPSSTVDTEQTNNIVNRQQRWLGGLSCSSILGFALCHIIWHWFF